MAGGWTIVEEPPSNGGWSVVEPTVSADGTVPNLLEAAVVAKAAKQKGAYQAGQTDENRAEARDTLRAMANGATFNMAPRLEAGARAVVGDGTYTGNLDQIRDENDAYAAEHPLRAGAANLIGGVAVPGPAVLNTTRAVAGAARAAGAAPAVATAAGVTSAGTLAGGVSGIGEAEDWTDPAGTAVTVAKNAAAGGAGAAALGVAAPAAGRVLSGVGGIARDAVGRVTNSPRMAQSWAERKRQAAVDALVARNGDTTENAAARRMASTFADDALRGEQTPVGYVMRDSMLGQHTKEASKVPSANMRPLVDASEGMTHNQHGAASDFINDGVPLNRRDAVPVRQDYVERSTTAMTPGYENLGPQAIHTPELQNLARQDENVARLLRESAPAAASEGRLPYADVGRVGNISNGAQRVPLPQAEIDRINGLKSLSPAAKQQAIARAQALQPPVPNAPNMTFGVAENMLRRGGGRVNPENSADVVTDMHVVGNVENALAQDSSRPGNDALAAGIQHRQIHRGRKQDLEDFDRAYAIFDKSGVPALEARAELPAALSRNHTPSVEGLRTRVNDMVSDSNNETIRNVHGLLSSPERQRVMAEVLSSGGAGPAQGQQQANRILDHLQQRGERATYAQSVDDLMRGSVTVPKEAAETFGRALITERMTPGLGAARLLQLSGQGMSKPRADAVIRMMAEDATPAVAQQYSDMARQAWRTQAARALLRERLGMVGGQAGAYAVGQ